MRNLHRIFGILSSVIVLAVLVAGFAIVGSPGTERERKFDDRRIDDLRVINSEINNIVYGIDPTRPQPTPPAPVNPLPSTLREVVEGASFQRPNIADPATGEPYGYRVIDGDTYELCATFSFAQSEPFDVQWNHPGGPYCFQFDTAQSEEPMKPVPVR
jgi:hypothetical protein